MEFLLRQQREDFTAEPKPKAGPPISEETAELAELREINDRLAGVIIAIRSFAGKQAGVLKIPPRDRPKVATDRVRERLRIERHQALVARVIRKEE